MFIEHFSELDTLLYPLHGLNHIIRIRTLKHSGLQMYGLKLRDVLQS